MTPALIAAAMVTHLVRCGASDSVSGPHLVINALGGGWLVGAGRSWAA